MSSLVAGSLRKKGKYYYYTFTTGGKRYYDVATEQSTKTEAINTANEIYLQYSGQTFDRKKHIANKEYKTLFKAVEEYLIYLRNDVMTGKIVEGTYNEKKTAFDILRRHFNSETLLCEIFPRHIEELYQKMALTRTTNTVAKYHSFYRKMFQRCVRDGDISDNPFLLVDPPKRDRYRRAGQTLSSEQMNNYIDFLLKEFPLNKDSGFLSSAVLLGAFGGLRREEVIGLATDKISFNDDGEMIARIERVVVSCNGTIIERDRTKNEASRDIVVYPKFVADLIMQRINFIQQSLKKTKCGSTLDSFESKIWLVSDLKNNRIDPNRVTRTHSKALEMASLPRIRFHDLRHTHATILLDSGVPVVQVSKRLRHKRPSTTLDIYYDPDDRKIDDLGKAFNEAVCGDF